MSALYGLFDFLIHPTFFDPNNPPLKVNVSAKLIGIVAAILGALGLLSYLILIPATLAIGTAATVFGVAVPGTVHPGILIVAMIGLIVGLIAEILWTWGGYLMYQEKPEGKSMVVVAIAVSVIGSLIFNIGSATIGGWIWNLLISAVIYYFVMISRFTYETPLAATATEANPPPPGPPPAQ